MADMRNLTSEQVFQQFGLVDVVKQGMYADHGENATRDANVATMRIRGAVTQELYNDLLSNPGAKLAERGGEVSHALAAKEAELIKANKPGEAEELGDIRGRLDNANKKGVFPALKPELGHQLIVPGSGESVGSQDVAPQTSLPIPDRAASAPSLPGSK